MLKFQGSSDHHRIQKQVKKITKQSHSTQQNGNHKKVDTTREIALLFVRTKYIQQQQNNRKVIMTTCATAGAQSNNNIITINRIVFL